MKVTRGGHPWQKTLLSVTSNAFKLNLSAYCSEKRIVRTPAYTLTRVNMSTSLTDNTDEFDNRIGLTYPRRAQGLIKHGRAEYVSDDRIRLLKGAHAPSANNDTEDIKMSNIINFNAQEFKFDEGCQSTGGPPANAFQPFS